MFAVLQIFHEAAIMAATDRMRNEQHLLSNNSAKTIERPELRSEGNTQWKQELIIQSLSVLQAVEGKKE
jgi:hypothetical protein